jgi:molybdenum cofactor cytidylyltransferase
MRHQPVVIVYEVAPDLQGPRSNSLPLPLSPLGVLHATMTNCLSSGLPVILVATAAMADKAQRIMAIQDIVVPPDELLQTPPDSGLCMALGVAARPHASAWLAMPSDMFLVKASTINAVAGGLAFNPAVCAQYGARKSWPAGFGAELFSELISLKGPAALRRLMARYPVQGIEVMDSGVLIGSETEADSTMSSQQRSWGIRKH